MATMEKKPPTEEEKSKIWDAASTGNVDIIQTLANNGVDVTGGVDPYGHQRTALHVAASYGHYNVVAYLLSHGARVNDVDSYYKWTALHEAAINGHYNVVAYLLSHGARVNDVTSDKRTALHMAARYGHYNVVACLLSHGARVNDVDNRQWTPLHHAAYNGHAEIADLLVKNKASISMKDNENKTPLQLAVEEGKSDVVYVFYKQQKMDITQFDDKTQQKIDELVKRAEKKQAGGVSVNAQLVKGAVVIRQIMDKQSTPTMRDLNRYVITNYATDWEKIGLELEVQDEILKIISADNQRRCVPCFQSMLSKWLELNPKATWSTLEVAITNVKRTSNGLDPITDVYGTS